MPVPHLFGNESGFIKRDFLDDNFAALAGSYVNVQGYPFFAKGDGVTDDTVAIQAAQNTGHALYFPTPSNYYRTSFPININGGRWVGETATTTIIRNMSGAGNVLQFGVGVPPFTLDSMRIGGPGCIGIASGVGGYAQYVAQLYLINAHFESDLADCINCNLIFYNDNVCSFGFFSQFGVHAAHRHLVISFGGANNVNMNSSNASKFYNSKGAYSCSLTGGGSWRFVLPDWENNIRNLATSNLSDLTIHSGYCERVLGLTGQAFDFGTTRTRTRVLGGTYNCTPSAAGFSAFGAAPSCQLLLEDCDIGTHASGFCYVNSTTLVHFPTSTHDLFTSNRFQGNAADPMLAFDGVLPGVPVNFTPTANAFTIVNGTGGVGFTGSWSLLGRTLTVNIKALPTGTATIASVGGASYFDAANVNFVPPIAGAFAPAIDSGAATTANGFMYINGRYYGGAFAATNSAVYWSGTTKI